jgi:hypothetical protein
VESNIIDKISEPMVKSVNCPFGQIHFLAGAEYCNNEAGAIIAAMMASIFAIAKISPKLANDSKGN